MLTYYTKSLLISGLIFCGLIRPAFAQTQFAGWAATFQNYKLSPRTGLYFDAQWRSTGQVRQMQALLLRPGINFYLTPSLTGTVGYAFIPQQRVSGGVEGYLPEHRVWEQLVFTHAVKLGAHHTGTRHHSDVHQHAMATLQHRLRLEQRFIPRHHAEGGELVHDGHRYAGRLRYFARAVVPLSGQAGWFAAVQNEIFFNAANASFVNGKFFDQNRAYLAAGYRLSKQFDMELGYMNQYISGAGANSTNNHIVQLATYLRL
jgi:hypothetical protein